MKAKKLCIARTIVKKMYQNMGEDIEAKAKEHLLDLARAIREIEEYNLLPPPSIP